MNTSSCLKRLLGYFPLAAWRRAWRRLRLYTLPVARGALSRNAGFAIRSPDAHPLEFPADLDPRIAAAVRQSVQSARERFLSGVDLEPVAEIVEKGLYIRASVMEIAPQQPAALHTLSVFPKS